MQTMEPQKLKALKVEVDALDLLPPSLEVLERMVTLIAEHFSVPTTASYHGSGKDNSPRYLAFQKPRGYYMGVSLEDGRYHCSHQAMADRYETVETVTSSAAFYFVIGHTRPWERGYA